jgi:hypothetical protein
MAFILRVLHVPSQEYLTFGPWPGSDDPVANASATGFAHGFVAGINSRNGGMPQDLAEYTVVEVPDEDPGAQVVGVIVAEASATVTHADGTTD